MLSFALGKRRFNTASPRCELKAVTKRLLPIPTAGESAECIAPAAFCPIGHPAIDDTGILFPVFFWPRANRAGTLHKPGAPEIPAIPAAAFPAVGMAPSSFNRAKPLRFALFFCSGHDFNSPPVPPAGVASENAAPAAFGPAGHRFRNDSGILFPVFFWPCANRAGTLHKPGAPKIPAIPAAAFPAVGKAPILVQQSEAFTLRSYFFARLMIPTVLLLIASGRPTVARV